MIGQRSIIDWIDRNLDNFPTFIIFVAPRGCGKRMLAHYVARKLGANYAPCGVKVDEVREVINTAYSTRDKALYCFEDADTMRAEAKNAMLKVTEEPPANAYFCMTVEDESSLLDTIKSRGHVILLQPYTRDEIKDYVLDKYGEDAPMVICDVASTPREADLMVQYGPDFMDYVELVVDNVAEVQPANAFKSSGKLALKNEEDKYDLKLFWNAFISICIKRVMDDSLKYTQGVCTTIPYLLKCERLGVNKVQLYDDWVFNIREVWQ